MLAIANRFVLAAGASIALAGCAGHTNIHYTERYACTLVVTGSAQEGGTEVPPAGHYYSVFTVTGVANNNKGATDFTFDPTKLYVKVGGKTIHQMQGKIGTGSLKTSVPVPAGKTTTYLGRVAFDIPAGLTPGNVNIGPTNMFYDAKNVLMFRQDSAAPQFLGTCDTDKLPQ